MLICNIIFFLENRQNTRVLYRKINKFCKYYSLKVKKYIFLPTYILKSKNELNKINTLSQRKVHKGK